MRRELRDIRIGLAMVFLGLVFGISMGIAFGIDEDLFKDFIASGIAANPAVHDESSPGKIWRYAQRAHFHATGIAAFSLGLIILLALSDMKARLKKLTSILIGLGGLYPLAWLNMFVLAPAIGRGAAHEQFLTLLLTYVGVGGVGTGVLLLIMNLFFGASADDGSP